MTVIPLARAQSGNVWSKAEHTVLVGTLDDASDKSWDTGVTELGDAQFYVLGPLPEQACEMCVSRIGARFVLEDGAGRVVLTHHSLPVVASHLRLALGAKRWRVAAPLIAMWCAVRSVFHDRIEPVLIESEEAAVHFVPQLAAFV